MIHKFEKAGLGKAPFRVIGVEDKRGPLRYTDPKTGGEITVGAPGQPMGSCDYCGTGIAECWTIRSADGQESIIGSTCIGKAGDAGLKKVVNKHRGKATKARETKRINDLSARLKCNTMLRALLASKPHPNVWRAGQNETLLDSVEWMMSYAGHSGQIKTVRLVAKIEKAS
jgi:hypothetical protein